MPPDFIRICVKEPKENSKNTTYEVYSDLVVGKSQDLMIRGQAFYAIWDPELGLWNTSEYRVQELVDEAILEHAAKLKEQGLDVKVKLLKSYDTERWNKFKRFVKAVSDNSHQLDSTLTFANSVVKKTDYVSKRLPYSLAPGDYSAWDELMSTLYSPEEREKIEWAIGSIIAGDSKKIEKFLVFFGPGGTGKSTILKIIQKLFVGYVAMFEAKALVGNNNAFATAAFKNHPLVAIQHDGDLSKIEDNSVLNSVVGHDTMWINEKYKAGYETELPAMLFMGTNKPVKITDAKSGLIRRLIDVRPTGAKIDSDRYHALMAQIEFQLGAIAQHCLDVYRNPGTNEYKAPGKNRYNRYEPTSMRMQTDYFYNYIEWYHDVFTEQDGTTLKQAWEFYKAYASVAELNFKTTLPSFREALKDYFEEYHDRTNVDGSYVRSVYKGFKGGKFMAPVPESNPPSFKLVLEKTESLLDDMYAGMPAQYANVAGAPKLYWDDSERIDKKTGEPYIPSPSQIVSTYLGDLDTSRLHYLKVPQCHIVIDFDLEDESGEKSLDLNLAAASLFPPTYAEVSKSGKAVHLHYIWDGDTSLLDNKYAEGIEIKVFSGNSSLRRKLSKCNDIAVATISSGLPFKEKKVLPKAMLETEQGLRTTIARCLRKENHGGTKPEMEFIEHILTKAYDSGIIYDVSDLEPYIMAFAASSVKNSQECLRILNRLPLQSKNSSEDVLEPQSEYREEIADQRIVFFDVEVFPNFFGVCWKYDGEDDDSVVRMSNPTPAQIADLLRLKLVGFNNRVYDNHILWARVLGASNEQLYKLSKQIIEEKNRNAMFMEAYNLSYADVWDFAATKIGLKPWQIALGIKHVEAKVDWNAPLPDERIEEIMDYCANDVNSLEKVFHHLKQDFVARHILADLSGLTVNSTTRKHTERILFGMDRQPQGKFVYTELDKKFPGYEFNEFAKGAKSTYKGRDVGEGGFVFGKPGMYYNVAVLDVASMHPHSISTLNLFGPYTDKYRELMEARLTIKHIHVALDKENFDYAAECAERAKQMLDGKLISYIEEIERLADISEQIMQYKTLEKALKLVLNSVYGFTAATFPNSFKDPRNKDNIVAKYGALFMIDLLEFVENLGYEVIHIKTDSIKIPNANAAIIQEIMDFAENYGFEFEHETTYEKICLVNDAVFIAKDHKGWHATGAEFKHPVVFKELFTKEQIDFKDLCETKQSRDGSTMFLVDGDYRQQIGKVGLFVAVKDGKTLVKAKPGGKDYAVPGTKGYLWAEADVIRDLAGEYVERMGFDLTGVNTGGINSVIDVAYYAQLAESAVQSINKFGDFEEFAA